MVGSAPVALVGGKKGSREDRDGVTKTRVEERQGGKREIRKEHTKEEERRD